MWAIAIGAGALAGACVTRLNTGLNIYCDEEFPCLDRQLKCDMDRHFCVSATVTPMVECDATHPCAASAPICDAMTKKCGACTMDAQCDALDKTKPRCLKGVCAQCTPGSKIDCAMDATKALCDAAGFCRGCKSGSECTDGVCYDDGRCAPPDDFIYVNADTCMMRMPDGSAGAPLCEVADAIPLVMANKRVVKIAGSLFAYVKTVAIPGKDVILSGPGRDAMTTARFQVIGASAITIDPNSKVVIDGLTISGAGNDGITCSSNSKLTVLRSKLDGNHQAGLNAGSCDVTIDQSWFETNRYGALRFGPGAKYVVTNSFLINNGVSAPAVTIDPTAMGTFAFDTVANNYGPSFGAIDCGMGATPKVIERSIVWNNGTRPGPSQFNGDCKLVDTLTGEDTADGAIKDMPLVDGATFKLMGPVGANPAIDRVKAGASGLLPDHDGNNRPRPSGKGWDVGADEFQQ